MDIICIWPPVVRNLQSFTVVRLQISLDSGRGHQEVHVCAEVSQQSLGQGRTKGPRVLDWLCLAAQRYWWIVLQALLFVALVMSLLCKGVSHCYVLVATAGWCGRFQALASWGWILRSGEFHVHDPRGYGGISIQNLETLSMFSLVKRSNQMAVCWCNKNWIRFGCYLFASRLGFPCYAGADHKAEGGRKEGTSKSWGGLEVAWTRLGEL